MGGPALRTARPGASGRTGRAGRARVSWRAVFFALVAVAIVATLGWALLGSRLLIVRSVHVTGTGPLVSQARVLHAARIPPGLPLIRVNAAAVAGRVERIQQIQSATVTRDWPSTVTIAVRLRTPVFAVASGGGYALVDAYGVDVRWSATRPPALPLLAQGSPATPLADSLPGRGAVRAAARVLAELPPAVAHRVQLVMAASPSAVSVRLAGGVVVVWGSPLRGHQKATELMLLMRTHARYYDISAPGTAVTRG